MSAGSREKLRREEYRVIHTSTQLKRLAERMGKVTRVGLDTEADSLHHYYEKLCLLQLSFQGRHYILDPLSDADFTPVLDVLREKTLIIHAAEFDLRMLLTSFNFRPGKPIFDTLFAAQLLGHTQVGLAALVERYARTTLSKRSQKADWSQRPLPEPMLQYASDDTRFLESLHDRMSEELAALGRIPWHEECCRRLVAGISKRKPRDPDLAWRIKGSSRIRDRRQLAFVRVVWSWRESEAQKADRPPFKVLGNLQLIDLAVKAAQAKKPVAEELVPLPKNCQGRRLKALQAAVERARKLPADDWPRFLKGRRPENGPDYAPQVEALRKECLKKAQELRIDASVLAPKALLAAVVRSGARTQKQMTQKTTAMNWQAQLLEPLVEKALGKFPET